MTIRVEVSAFYNALTNAENNTLGFLGNPEAPLENYESFLQGVSLPFSVALLQQRTPKNGSYLEGAVSIPIFTLVSLRRELSVRKMTRRDYYLLAGSETQSEVSRLDKSKINIIQMIAGNTAVSNRGQVM